MRRERDAKEIETARLIKRIYMKEGHSRERAPWWQMYVSMYTQVTHIVSKYVCMYVCMHVDSLSLSPRFTPRPASLASLLANWVVALFLAFHVNAVCFKRFSAGPADTAWCWLIVFFKLFYCQRRQSGLKSGGHESGHRKFGFRAKMFSIFKIKF